MGRCAPLALGDAEGAVGAACGAGRPRARWRKRASARSDRGEPRPRAPGKRDKKTLETSGDMVVASSQSAALLALLCAPFRGGAGSLFDMKEKDAAPALVRRTGDGYTSEGFGVDVSFPMHHAIPKDTWGAKRGRPRLSPFACGFGALVAPDLDCP